MNEMKAALKERQRQEAVAEMLNGANEATNAAEKQKQVHYNEMIKKIREKDYRRATRHAKMYIFMDKLSIVSKEYAGLIQDQKAITEMFSVMTKMNKNFHSFMSMTNAGVTRKAVKNLKKFRTSVARFDKDMDKMLSAIDSMFDEPQKKRKKGEEPAPPSDNEESLLKLIGSNRELADRFESEPGGEAVTQYISTEPGAGTPSQTSTPGDGGFTGVGNPYDI